MRLFGKTASLHNAISLGLSKIVVDGGDGLLRFQISVYPVLITTCTSAIARYTSVEMHAEIFQFELFKNFVKIL